MTDPTVAELGAEVRDALNDISVRVGREPWAEDAHAALSVLITKCEQQEAVVKAAGPVLAQWLQGRADWNEGRGAMTTEERALKDALAACGVEIGWDETGLILTALAVSAQSEPFDPKFPHHVQGCICPRFHDIAPDLIADLTCPVHGIEGTDPGDKCAGYRRPSNRDKK